MKRNICKAVFLCILIFCIIKGIEHENGESKPVYAGVSDLTPPSTRIVIGEPFCIYENTTWVTSKTCFTLVATDNKTMPSLIGSGVDVTFYSIDGGVPQIYETPFNLSGYPPDIPHNITFWSIDYAGNVEEKNTYENIIIDDTPPELWNESVSSTTGNESTVIGYNVTYVEDTGRLPSFSDNFVVINPNNDEHPRHVIDYEGNVHVVWMSNRTGKWEIYYKQIDPDGSIQEISLESPYGKIIKMKTRMPKIIVNDTIISDSNSSDSMFPSIALEEHEEVFLNDTIYRNKYALLAAPVRYYIDQEQKLYDNKVLVNTALVWQEYVPSKNLARIGTSFKWWIDVLIYKDNSKNYSNNTFLTLTVYPALPGGGPNLTNPIFTKGVAGKDIPYGYSWLAFWDPNSAISIGQVYYIVLQSTDPYYWCYKSSDVYPNGVSSIGDNKDFTFIERYDWPEIRFKHELSMMRDYLINNGYSDANIYALTIPYWIWDNSGNRNIWRILGGFKHPNGSFIKWQPKGYNFNAEFSWIDGNATYDNLLRALNSLKNISTSDDLVFINLIDHGGGWKNGGGYKNGWRFDPVANASVMTDPRWQNDEFEDGTDEAFCTYANPNEEWSPRNTANFWYDDELDIKLDEISYRHMVIVIDTCHSGGFIPDLCGPNRIVCTSGREDEITYSYVYRFYERIDKSKSPDADLNKDGRISVREAHSYACQMIAKEFKKNPSHISHPQLNIWDNLHVVWIDKRNTFPEIYYSKIGSIVNYSASSNGIDLTTPDYRVSGNDGSASGRIVSTLDDAETTIFIEHPDICIDSKHNVSIVWSDYRDSQWQIYYQMQDNASNGIPTTLIDDTRISNGNMASISPAIDADSKNNVHIAWQKKRWELLYWDYEKRCPVYGQIWEICYEKLNPYLENCDGSSGNDGNMAVVDDIIVSSLDAADSASPDISVDESGVTHIAFMDKRSVDPGHESEATHMPNQWEIYTLALVPNVYPFFPVYRIYEKRQSDMYHAWKEYGDYIHAADGASMYPSIETTGNYLNGDTFISWHDNRNGNWEIYYSEMANCGNNPSADIRVTSNHIDDMYADIAVYKTNPDIKWQSKPFSWDIRNSYWKPHIKVKIDGILHNMLPSDTSDNNSSDGITYTYGLHLSPGIHNFSFNASNCLMNVNTTVFNLPVIDDTSPPLTCLKIGQPAYRKKIIDQKQLFGEAYKHLQPSYYSQSFIPNVSRIDAISLLLISNGNQTGEIRVRLRNSSSVIGESFYDLGYLTNPTWVQFDFDDGISVDRETYFFDVFTDYNYSWAFAYSNITDKYENGTGSMNESNLSFDWTFKTEYVVNCITSHTPIYLNSTDIFGTGVNRTYYRIWNNGWSDWIEYTENLTIEGNGLHYMEYYSIDNSGNWGNIKNITFFVDDAPPIISNVVAKPLIQLINRWVNITCVVNDFTIKNITLHIIFPDNTCFNVSMNKNSVYYFNQTYSMHGNYTYFIEAIDMLGNSNTSENFSFKINAPPLANFSWQPPQPKAGKSIQFNDESYDVDGCIVNRTWYFGDGGIAYGSVVNHTYLEEGYYNVTLFVRDNDGSVANTTKQIFVLPLPCTAYVDDDYNESTIGWQYDRFDKIQDAIDGIAEKGTVYVLNGTYYENVTINKSINLIAESKHAIIDASGKRNGVYIGAGHANISNFTIRNASENGILMDANHVSMKDNKIMDVREGVKGYAEYSIFANNEICDFGDYGFWVEGHGNHWMENIIHDGGRDGIILVYSTDNNTMEGNTIYNLSYGYGIRIYLSHGNIIRNNTIFNNNGGIKLHESSHDNDVINCKIYSNKYYGIRIENSFNNSIYDCKIYSNGNDGILVYSSTRNNVSGCNIYSNKDFGVWISYSNYNNISCCNISLNGNTGAGMGFSSIHNIIYDCEIYGNGDGVYIASPDNIISSCSISSNDYRGINVWQTSNNMIYSNYITSNQYGIYLSSCSSNLIYNNYFNNTINALDNGNNTWNISKTAGENIMGGNWLGGSYWHDYNGSDANMDGIGDTMLPYNCNGNILHGGDMLPLIYVSDVIPPAIANITFPFKAHFEFINITCVVNDDSGVAEVWINITFPDGSYINETMHLCHGLYFFNASFNMEGAYSFYIYAIDVNGNKNRSMETMFQVHPPWDINMDNNVNVLDLIVVAQHFGSHKGEENYAREVDLNSDGEINVLDLIIVAMHWTG